MTNQNQVQSSSNEQQPQPFRQVPAKKKTPKETIIMILLIINLVISTIGLVGVAYIVSVEKDRSDQMGDIGNGGFRGGNFDGQFPRGQMPEGGSFPVNPDSGTTN